jgi:hypothetical protein
MNEFRTMIKAFHADDASIQVSCIGWNQSPESAGSDSTENWPIPGASAGIVQTLGAVKPNPFCHAE